MESDRCKAFVKNEMIKLGLHCKKVELGEVEIKENLLKEQMQTIDNALKNGGLELIIDKKRNLIEKIKDEIYQFIYPSDDLTKTKFSDYISKKINCDYASLSNLFSRIQGVTIEKYMITQKIERAKGLLAYGMLTLNDIAWKLQYSSVAHLSNQFKKITGFTPSFFRLHWNTLINKSQNV